MRDGHTAALVTLFALLTTWLNRRRFVDPIKDEDAARVQDADADAHFDADFKRSYLFDLALVTLFALTTWLYRRRFVDPIKDEEAARVQDADADAHSDADFKRSYLFDPRKSFRLLAPSQVARIALVSFRSADAYPDPSVPAF
jgi:hypothetical protein